MGDIQHATHVDGGLELDDYANSKFHLIDALKGKVVYLGDIKLRKEKTQLKLIWKSMEILKISQKQMFGNVIFQYLPPLENI